VVAVDGWNGSTATAQFTNRDDDLDGLKTQLDQRFDSAQVEVVGAVGIFSART
jgi:hypothetical protein